MHLSAQSVALNEKLSICFYQATKTLKLKQWNSAFGSSLEGIEAAPIGSVGELGSSNAQTAPAAVGVEGTPGLRKNLRCFKKEAKAGWLISTLKSIQMLAKNWLISPKIWGVKIRKKSLQNTT